MAYCFHPQHSLECCYNYDTRPSKCAACELVIRSIGYRCGLCDFDIHTACSCLPGSISMGGHRQHELSLTKLPPGASRWCNICKETSHAGAYMYRCVPCDYDVHPRCTSLLAAQLPTPARRHNDSVHEHITHAALHATHAMHMMLRSMASSGAACTIL